MIKIWLTAALLALPGAALAGAPGTHEADQATLGIDHERHPAPGVWVGGPPDEDAIDRAAEAGVRHIVNLMPAAERPDYDVESHAEKAGIRYHTLAISGADDLDRDAVEAFDTILREIGDEALLMHCASGNRVGAMMALRSGLLYELPPDDALAVGRHYGLTGLEDAVKQQLAGD